MTRVSTRAPYLSVGLRPVLLVVALWSAVQAQPAQAHVIAFDILLPKEVGNEPDDAGVFKFQWFDQETAGASASARLMVSRRALPPFTGPNPFDSLEVSGPIPLASPIDFADWNTRDAGQGCWQPYADIQDPVEGTSVARAAGLVSTQRGAALWVTTPPGVQANDAGFLTLQWDLFAPDALISVDWRNEDANVGTLAAALPVAAGTPSASYTVDLRRFPPRPTWIHFTLISDAGSCDAWWRGTVTGRAEPAPDGGTDAGARDGGDGGDGGGNGKCGCQLTPASLVSPFALAWVVMLRRRRGGAQGPRSGDDASPGQRCGDR